MGQITVPPAAVTTVDFQQPKRPKYLRTFLWANEDCGFSPTIMSTLTDLPLPRPPQKELDNPVVSKTIRENPSLFAITTPVNVDLFEKLLINHPNPPFVRSVCDGLRFGFWPWADTQIGIYPDTWDASDRTSKTDAELAFIREQRDIEVSRGRFSKPFGRDLLPGMYSMPVHAVPKPNSDDLRLVTNHSATNYSLNSMIPRSAIAGARLDGLDSLGDILLAARRNNKGKTLILFKSDVAEAYRLLPMHPYWQIKQINTIDGERSVDRNNTFGDRGSGRLFICFMGLVAWIAVWVKLIDDMLAYSDDGFSWDFEGNVLWYPPYKRLFPAKQTRLLLLWDELGIPHKEKKQLFGSPLTIIGLEVDANRLSITMPETSKSDLLAALRKFAAPPKKNPRRFTLKEYQQLAGHFNWALNVFPLLKPGLCNVYSKMTGKVDAHKPIRVNDAVREDLTWAADHMERSSGVHMLRASDWDPYEADIIIFCDASMEKMGFWYPQFSLGYQSPFPIQTPDDTIFFFEALCVCSAITHAPSLGFEMQTLAVFTDNQNTVDIFNSLRASPPYNNILKSSIDIQIANGFDLRVVHISGEENRVADAISRGRDSLAQSLVSGLTIHRFDPPRSALGRRPQR